MTFKRCSLRLSFAPSSGLYHVRLHRSHHPWCTDL